MTIWISRAKIYSLLLGGSLAVLLSSIVLIGWIFHYEPLIRIKSSYAAMTFNTALFLLLLGLAEILLAWEKKWPVRFLAGFVAIFSLLIAIQYPLHINLGLDNLFFQYNLSTPMEYPGRMALNTGFCLILISFSLLISTFVMRKLYSICNLLLASLVLSIAGTSLFGYITGLEEAASWAHYSRMAVHTAICLIFLALPKLTNALLYSIEHKASPLAFSTCGVLGSLVATIAIYQAFQAKEFLAIKENATLTLAYVVESTETALTEQNLALVRMSHRLNISEFLSKDLWDKDTENYLADIQPLLSLELFDINNQLLAKNYKPTAVGLSLDLQPFSNTIKQGFPFFFSNPSTKIYYIFIPTRFNQTINGFLLATLSSNILIQSELKKLPAIPYIISFQQGQSVFESFGNGTSPTIGAPLIKKLDPKLLPWEINLYITEAASSDQSSTIHLFIGLTGTIFSLLLGGAVYFGFSLIEKTQYLNKVLVDLKSSSNKVQEAAALKSLFLANMSHEIRTPLNAVIGTIQLLAETELNETQHKYTQRIYDSGTSLLKLINDILDFSKIESGTLTFAKEQVNLENVARNAILSIASKAKEKNLDLFLELPAHPLPEITTDSYRLQQIFSNLANNAIKFTEKGYVILRIKDLSPGSERLHLSIEVQDTGIGISPEDRSKLFQKFSQVESSQARKFGGIGLGLSICKRIVEFMGGEIGVQSEVGKGSTFWVKLSFPQVFSPIEKRILPKEKKVLLLDPKEKEKEILAQYLQSWGSTVTFDPKEPASLLVLAEESMDALKDLQLPTLLLSQKELEQLPNKISAYVSRPILPKEFYEKMKALIGT